MHITLATIAAAAPQMSPEMSGGTAIQLGAGSVAVALLVWTISKLHSKHWPKSPVITGFIIGTVTAGAGGLLGMPGHLATSLVAGVGQAIGNINVG